MREIIYSFLKQSGDLLNILGMIGMAFLTTLISAAVVIFNGKKKFEILDRNVILDHVVKAKFFLVYLGLIFLPLLFWNSLPVWLRFAGMTFWVVGIYFMSKILVNSYYWMKENKFDLRFNYLKNLKNAKDMEESWRSVWQVEKINLENEQEFFEIFSSTIEQLLGNNERKNLETMLKLLGDFNAFIDNRSIFLIVSKKVFSKILEWHFVIWEKYLDLKDNLDECFYCFSTLRTLESFLKKTEERSLKEGESSSFFESFKSHVEKYKEKYKEKKCIQSEKNKKFYYINSIIPIFFKTLAENIGKTSEIYNMFDMLENDFPAEWKITVNNKDDKIPHIILKEFLRWSENRIFKKENEKNYDEDLTAVVKGIFPNVHPLLFTAF